MTSRYIIIVVSLAAALLYSSCSNHSLKKETTAQDSTDVVHRIREMGLSEPNDAIALADSAENEGLIPSFYADYLRSIACHNGLCDYKQALDYALRAYNDPDARGNKNLFLDITELVADEYRINGEYAQSIKYCT